MATIADHLSHALTRMKRGEERPDLGRVSELAKNCEERADEIVRRSSRLLDQTTDGYRLRRLLSQADDVADTLEGTAFMLTIMPRTSTRNHLNARGARRAGQPQRPRTRPLLEGPRSLAHRKPGRDRNSGTIEAGRASGTRSPAPSASSANV
jgi:hypothetical protein